MTAAQTVAPVPRMGAVERRLAPLFVAFFLGGVALWVPVEKLFMREIGFTPQTVGLMAAVYAAVVPVLEIPSGILADRWSRRGVLVIGNISVFLSVLIGGLSSSVTTYLVAAALLGVFFAMQSGTLEAIVYDAVVEETGSSARFESMLGRVRMAESASLVLGALAGGGLATMTAPRVTYFATLPFAAASTISLLRFREPQLHEASDPSSLRRQVGVTVGALRGRGQLLPVVALLVAMAVLTQAVFEFGPLWIISDDGGAGSLGPSWAALMVSLGAGGFVASRVQLDRSTTIVTIVGLLLGSSLTLVVAHSVMALTAAQFVLVTLSVAIGIALTARLHDAIDSEVRAGVASCIGLLTWVTFLPFALVFGTVADRAGVHVAGWLVVGLAGVVTGLFVHVSSRPAASGELAPCVPCAVEPLRA